MSDFDFEYKEIFLQLNCEEVAFECAGDLWSGKTIPRELSLIIAGEKNEDVSQMLLVPQIKEEVIEQLKIVFADERERRADYG